MTYVLPEEMTCIDTKEDLRLPTLSINSDSYYWRLYPCFDNEERLFRLFNASKKLRGRHLNLTLYGNSHINFTDLSFYMAGEFQFLNVSNKDICPVELSWHQLRLMHYLIELNSEQIINKNGISSINYKEDVNRNPLSGLNIFLEC